MTVNLTDWIAALAAVIATGAAIYARRQAHIAKAALEQQNELRLFEAFSECSTTLVSTPKLKGSKGHKGQ